MKQLLNLKDKLIYDSNKLKFLHSVDLLHQINLATKEIKQFTFPLRIKMSKGKWLLMWEDIMTEFGIWSHSFNNFLRKEIKDIDNNNKEVINKDKTLESLNEKYKYVYAYWWNSYHLITEVYQKKTKIAGRIKKKHIEKGRKTLSELITGQIKPEKINKKFLELIEKLNSEKLPVNNIKKDKN